MFELKSFFILPNRTTVGMSRPHWGPAVWDGGENKSPCRATAGGGAVVHTMELTPEGLSHSLGGTQRRPRPRETVLVPRHMRTVKA